MGRVVGVLTVRAAALVCLSVLNLPATASVSIYVGRNLTADGSVLLAGYGDEPSSHWLVLEPRRQHPRGATITVGATAEADLPGERMEIPQVEETARFLSMDYSYFAGFPAPLTNGGMNEHGVAVRDVALFSRAELVEMTPRPQRGPHYSDIARIVLQRARTAREAVDVSVALIESHGYTTYGGNSHVFADSEEGWVLLEMAGGQGLWAARRLGPDDIWLNWRGFHEIGFIQELPTDWQSNPDYLASAGFVEFALEQGWHDGDGALDVIRTYARPDQYSGETAIEARQVMKALQAAAPSISPKDLMDALHATGKDSSGYGQVAHLRPDLPGNLRTLWVAPGPPSAAPFLPWRIGVGAVPPEFRRHRYLTAGEAERQSIDPAQQGLESTRYANRLVKRLQYLVNEHPARFAAEVVEALAEFEHQLLRQQDVRERTAQVLLSAGEAELATAYLTDQAWSDAARSLRLLEALAESIELRTKAAYGIRGE